MAKPYSMSLRERVLKDCDGLTAPLVVDGAINGEVFLAYVEQQLIPTLRKGDIVVMDNLSSHKVAGVKEAREKRNTL